LGVTSREVLQAALALPPEERAQLIEQLEASLPVEEEDDAFVAMINGRVAAAEAGAPGTPAEQVFAELLGE
jgi:putative addiction module component (TIGR02574 family)